MELEHDHVIKVLEYIVGEYIKKYVFCIQRLGYSNNLFLHKAFLLEVVC